MAEKNSRQRIDVVKQWFDNHPFVRWFELSLTHIDNQSTVVEMPICVKHCTGNGIVTGGVHAVLGNAAGVALAMMHSENFTPLAEINSLKFCRPVKLSDERLLAEAQFLGIEQNRILIKVLIKNSVGELKAEGIFEYALLDKPYNS
ncbi:MAG: PaaI family thioesterase [Candidatus Harrisonbacteria bacterium]|nr:PaaI family thioesterase [Candidatus Harrisonbacteria bacterium]